MKRKSTKLFMEFGNRSSEIREQSHIIINTWFFPQIHRSRKVLNP